MSLCKYESEIKQLGISQQAAYEHLSNPQRFAAFKERMNDPAVQERMKGLPAAEVEKAQQMLESLDVTEDSLSLTTPVGAITFRIVEREEPKLVKYAAENSPLPVTLWFQLLPKDAVSLLRVTLGAEVNMFMRPMVQKPLQEAANKLAEVIAMTTMPLSAASGAAVAEDNA